MQCNPMRQCPMNYPKPRLRGGDPPCGCDPLRLAIPGRKRGRSAGCARRAGPPRLRAPRAFRRLAPFAASKSAARSAFERKTDRAAQRSSRRRMHAHRSVRSISSRHTCSLRGRSLFRCLLTATRSLDCRVDDHSTSPSEGGGWAEGGGWGGCGGWAHTSHRSGSGFKVLTLNIFIFRARTTT